MRFTVFGRAEARLHFIGIGGAGMSSLARLLRQAGFSVTGSDVERSATTDDLEREGLRITIGHDATVIESLPFPDFVIVSSAVGVDDPELAAARCQGIPVIKRASLLGHLMEQRRAIAVSGTHGKTTTTALIASLLLKTGRDPTAMIGGDCLDLGSNARLGGGEAFVAEADEFDRSFLEMRPDVAIVTSVDPDHLDYYGSTAAVEEGFVAFMRGVRPGGAVVACVDQLPVRRLLPAVRVPLESYGLRTTAQWQAFNIAPGPSGVTFEASCRGASLGVFTLAAHGEHNVANALAALAACSLVGLSPDEARPHLATFRGTRRRFERLADPKATRGVAVVDDYAHHPAEVRATLRGARLAGFGPICALFQPHTMDRTEYLLGDFLGAFGDADCVVLTDTYSPRGREHGRGKTSAELARLLRQVHPRVRYAGGLGEAAEAAVEEVLAARAKGAPGALLLTMGAGNVWQAAHLALARLRS